MREWSQVLVWLSGTVERVPTGGDNKRELLRSTSSISTCANSRYSHAGSRSWANSKAAGVRFKGLATTDAPTCSSNPEYCRKSCRYYDKGECDTRRETSVAHSGKPSHESPSPLGRSRAPG